MRKSESLESLKTTVFLMLHINETCINKFGLLLSCILYYYGIILHLVSGHLYLYLHYFIHYYVLSYTCISVTVSDHLHTLHLYLYLRYCIRYLCFVVYMYSCDTNCICHLYVRYFIHRINVILYMYFCDIICICVYFIYCLLNILWISDFKYILLDIFIK